MDGLGSWAEKYHNLINTTNFDHFLMKTIHERLYSERQRLGLTQREAADGLGVSRSSFAHYEAGRAGLDMSLLEKAEKLGMDAWWLATGTPIATLAIDQVNLDALRSIVLSVTDFNLQHELNLTPAQQNELIRSLYRQFVDLKDDAHNALLKSPSKVAA